MSIKLKSKKSKESSKSKTKIPNNVKQVVSNNSNYCNDLLNITLSKEDITFTRNTLNNLHHLMYDETARKIFIEFSELEHSHNHILFWLEANEYKEKYIMVPERDTSLKPEKQDPESLPIELPKSEPINNNVQTPNPQNNNNNNNNNNSTIIISSSGGVGAISNTETSGNNKVSRESSNSASESDDEDDDVFNAQKSNMKNALYIFDKYLTPSSLLEVNLDFKTFIEIKKKIETNDVPLNIFDKSQKEIFEVIYNDSYFRFKNSSTFKYLIACTENNELSNSISKPIKKVKSSSSKKRSFLCFA